MKLLASCLALSSLLVTASANLARLPVSLSSTLGLGRRGGSSRLGRRGGGAPEAVNGLWSDYREAIDRDPVRTKTITSVSLALVGDAVAQFAGGADGFKALDQKRLFTNTVAGGLFIGPALHRWHNLVDEVSRKPEVEKRLPAKWGRPLFQLVLDQTVGMVVVNAGYYLTLWVVQAAVGGSFFPLGDLVDSIVSKFKNNFVSNLKCKWRVWPFAQIISFAFVPLPLRVLFSNVVSASIAIHKARKNKL